MSATATEEAQVFCQPRRGGNRFSVILVAGILSSLSAVNHVRAPYWGFEWMHTAKPIPLSLPQQGSRFMLCVCVCASSLSSVLLQFHAYSVSSTCKKKLKVRRREIEKGAVISGPGPWQKRPWRTTTPHHTCTTGTPFLPQCPPVLSLIVEIYIKLKNLYYCPMQ